MSQDVPNHLTPNARKALLESIAHWERLATLDDPTTERVGQCSCALCREFYTFSCYGCPVRARTGLPGCMGTPYKNAAEAFNCLFDPEGTLENFHSRAKLELQFLQSLLVEP